LNKGKLFQQNNKPLLFLFLKEYMFYHSNGYLCTHYQEYEKGILKIIR